MDRSPIGEPRGDPSGEAGVAQVVGSTLLGPVLGRADADLAFAAEWSPVTLNPMTPRPSVEPDSLHLRISYVLLCTALVVGLTGYLIGSESLLERCAAGAALLCAGWALIRNVSTAVANRREH